MIAEVSGVKRLFRTRYRVARDQRYSRYWAVQYRHWYWPFWEEWGNGLLTSREEAMELINDLRTEQ